MDPIIACATCRSPFEPRKNLIDGKVSWFPTCKHKVSSTSDAVLLDPETMEPISEGVPHAG